MFSTELGYQLDADWVHANINAYYSSLKNVSEYSMYYDDAENSFTYASVTGIRKAYYGVEAGLDFKVTSFLNIKMLGTISDAKYTNDADIVYMLSQDGKYRQDVVLSKDIREGCTPLTAGSIDLSYHAKGWYIDLIGNYYDRIYLYYTPVTRFESTQQLWAKNNYNGASIDNATGEYIYAVPGQAKGKGGFMLDASIGRQFYVFHHPLSVNLMLTNITNNTKIITGGYEQSRMNYSVSDQEINTRTYNFTRNPKKYYAQGINGMLNINYRF